MRELPRIFRNLDEAKGIFGACALTIGNFDGVHAGHRRILRRLVELARTNGWKPSALTFDPHPAKIVAPKRAPLLLTSPAERCALMAEEGIEQVLILPFDENFSHIAPEQFAREILSRALGVKAVLVGSNFRFGYRHAGDTTTLAALGAVYGFSVEIIPAVSLRGYMISSSLIRRLLLEGKVALAARLLERPHFLEGSVVRGHGIGSKLTVPTLNINNECEIVPAGGVYITQTLDANTVQIWPSLTNIGYRPTFGGKEMTIETYLLAPQGDINPTRIRIQFLKRLREERQFPDPASLKAQILCDVRCAEKYFQRLKRWVRLKEPRSNLLPSDHGFPPTIGT